MILRANAQFWLRCECGSWWLDLVWKVYTGALRTSVFIGYRHSPAALAHCLVSGDLAVLLGELTWSVFVNSAPVSSCGHSYQTWQHFAGVYPWEWTPISPGPWPQSGQDRCITCLFPFPLQFHHSDCLSTWLLHFIAANYLIFSQKPEFQDLSGRLLISVLKRSLCLRFEI